ncbi:MAG: ADYC domain-containing protein [Nannocystaceae bacterium]
MNRLSTTANLALALALAAGVACDAEVIDDSVGETQFRALTDNSAEINGIIVNGIIVNGIIVNGIIVNGIIVNGGEYGGITLESARAPNGDEIALMWTTIQSGRLMMFTEGGHFFHGEGVVGSKLTFHTDEGDYRIYVDDADFKDGGEFKGGGLYHYTLSVATEGEDGIDDDSRESLCFDGEGQPTDALLLPGEWDHETGERTNSNPTSMTAACRHAALAKCAEWGYRPGLLPSSHASCVRMVRADYAGDGVAHTENGTLIHVGDKYGINKQDSEPGLLKEAEWGPDGALCLNRGALRHPELSGCEDSNDPETCFPGIPACPGDPDDLKIKLHKYGAKIMTAISVDPQ